MAGAPIVQAKYDRLEEIARRFGHLADAVSADRTRMRQASERLIHGGWEGKGVKSFSNEMTSDLLPGMKRLSVALREAQRVTIELRNMIQQGEEEGAHVYNDNLGSVAGGGAGAAAGGGGAAGKGGAGGSARTASARRAVKKAPRKLRKGSKGAAVKKAQQRLKKLGYLLGPADGVFGPATEAAVKRFQNRNKVGGGLGVIGPATLKKLNSASAKRAPKPTSVKMSHGEAVATLQSAGIQSVTRTLEGVRRTTINGLIRFQKVSGLKGLIVTGGTSNAHAPGQFSHQNGYKLDISDPPAVTNWIKSHYKSIGTRSDGAPLYKDSKGNVYAHEFFKNHWDIQYFR